MRATVLLPTYNEEYSIEQTIDEVKKYVPQSQIIVVDSNSTDRTREIALQKGVLVTNTKERGKGRAIREAFSSIRSPYFIMLDSDYTYPAEYIPPMIDKLENGADVVMGWRKYILPDAMTEINYLGNCMLSLMAGILHGYEVEDVCTGMWGFRQEAIEKFKLTSNDFALEADLFVNACKTECLIEQIPIHYRARINGSKPKLKMGDGFKIGWFLIKKRFG